jgi:RNA recognition motif-containing protein
MSQKSIENLTRIKRINNLDSVVLSVIDKIASRAEVGFKKYGTNMDRKDLTIIQWIDHSIEEKMDDILYMEKIKRELHNITPYIQTNANGFDNNELSNNDLVNKSLNKRLFISNLQINLTWQKLKDIMRKYGDVAYVNIINNNKGIALVEFKNIDDINTIISKLNNIEIMGRKIKVRLDNK